MIVTFFINSDGIEGISIPSAKFFQIIILAGGTL
jgi:hypothetical protein